MRATTSKAGMGTSRKATTAHTFYAGLFITSLVATVSSAAAQDQSGDNAELATKLSNPVAAMISVPFQFNYDQKIGAIDEGHRTNLTLQPVIPMSIGDDWNLLSRTILPISSQSDIAAGSGHQFGLGDTLQSLFFSPKQPTKDGIIWGLGPALLLPTATNDLLGSKKWGAGPTLVMLKQSRGWTIGFLVNHIWSFASAGGSYDRRPPYISNTFIQPFLSYTTPAAWTCSINSESSYDGKRKQWTTPVNMTVAKLTRIGRQPISFAAGVRYWAKNTQSSPKGFGFRFTTTLLFPK